MPDASRVIAELPHAISDGQLCLHYQPQAQLATSRVTGVEALIRWQHPEFGLLSPGAFIPTIEQLKSAELMNAITWWVLDAALQQCRIWWQADLPICVAVNLSARNLEDATLPKTITRMLDKWQIPPSLLELEITETAIIKDLVKADTIFKPLRAMGVRIVLDDFGMGNTSLRELQSIAIDKLKIAKSFVDPIYRDPDTCGVLRGIIDLGHKVHAVVLAEGVEDVALWGMLTSFRCDQAQGYHLSRPVPAREFVRWLVSSSEWDLDWPMEMPPPQSIVVTSAGGASGYDHQAGDEDSGNSSGPAALPEDDPRTQDLRTRAIAIDHRLADLREKRERGFIKGDRYAEFLTDLVSERKTVLLATETVLRGKDEDLDAILQGARSGEDEAGVRDRLVQLAEERGIDWNVIEARSKHDASSMSWMIGISFEIAKRTH